MMTEQVFSKFCKKTIVDYVNQRTPHEALNITEADVFVVWMCKTLQNNKALLSTCVNDGMYYEITYNGDKEEAYIDAYRKVENYCIPFKVEV